MLLLPRNHPVSRVLPAFCEKSPKVSCLKAGWKTTLKRDNGASVCVSHSVVSDFL